MKTLKLRYSPYRIFQSSRTPAGLYARQKWLQEASSPSWKADFEATVAELYRSPSGDDLWAAPAMETIHRLFGLHLTVREPNAHINQGLDGLLAVASGARSLPKGMGVTANSLRGLPFAPDRLQLIVLSAACFLAAIFGRASDPIVLKLYERIVSEMTSQSLTHQNPATVHNHLRALVVHPHYGEHPATRNAVAWLAGRQTSKGDWGPDIPFYQALNSLAHLAFPAADRQCQSALDSLVQRQDEDGAWGATERQWSTFLAVHALKNKRRL